MNTAVQHTDIFGMSGLMKVPIEIPCDLMLRREANLYTPVIFLNKELPDVLFCIARELESLHSEDSLIGRLKGRKTAIRSGPLLSWYRSIFSDVFTGPSRQEVPAREAAPSREAVPAQTEKGSPPAFCIKGEIFVTDCLSCYQYVTLTLPPLWQDKRGLCAHTDLSSLSRWPAHNKNAQHRLFLFRFFPDTGTWYAVQSRSQRRRRIIQS